MDIPSLNASVAISQAEQGRLTQTQQAAAEAKAKQDLEGVEIVAKDFEAMFVAEMMKPMFEGIKPNELFGGGKGEEIFQGVLLQEYGKLMAETGQLGIAEAVKQQLINMQEVQDAESSIKTEAANDNG